MTPLLLFGGRAVGRDGDVQSHMGLLGRKAQKRLPERPKDLCRVPLELGAKVLCLAKRPAGFDEIDGGIDLGHVFLVLPQRIIAELCRDGLPGFGGVVNDGLCRRDAFRGRFAFAEGDSRLTDLGIGLARAPPRDGCVEYDVVTRPSGRDEQVVHRLEQGFGRSYEQGREVIRLDSELFSIRVQRFDRFEDDRDKVGCHRVEGDLRAGKHAGQGRTFDDGVFDNGVWFGIRCSFTERIYRSREVRVPSCMQVRF